MSAKGIIYWDDLAAFTGPCVVALGIFDGLHLGHCALLDAASACALQRHVPLVIVTFERDPDEFFAQNTDLNFKLTDNETRINMLASYKSSFVCLMPAQSSVFTMPAQAFLDELALRLHPRAIYAGQNFRFGADASGSMDDVVRWCSKKDCICNAYPLLEMDGEIVSATGIRRLIAAGKVKQAKKLLAGRAHTISGHVCVGKGWGKKLGFATANLDLSDNVCIVPAQGVYAAYVRLNRPDAPRYRAAVNIGTAPSFKDASAAVEAHILDFDRDIYGQTLYIEFEMWLRAERVFNSCSDLSACVRDNIAYVDEHLEMRP